MSEYRDWIGKPVSIFWQDVCEWVGTAADHTKAIAKAKVDGRVHTFGLLIDIDDGWVTVASSLNASAAERGNDLHTVSAIPRSLVLRIDRLEEVT